MPFGQNSLEKFTGKRVKKKQEKKETRKKSKEKETRGRELEHTDSLEPPPPIVEASLCLRSSLTLFQLFVQGRQLVFHLPDVVLREGLLLLPILELLLQILDLLLLLLVRQLGLLLHVDDIPGRIADLLLFPH